ncbi:hypothetical protein [Paenibacillus piri]|uniref:Uncharacterized protein n=1 Tax=Paenibacillus piri TaxID=2547395 RepID=A0A4R5KMY1_9BACL|nr:hypothetical protein [Paenibacillus piri]TDF96295.1 hypothetical protein E1757_18100 [Paenibacillus piri]
MIQRVVKNQKGKDMATKIRGTASYSNYSGNEKLFADFLLDDPSVTIEAEGYREFNTELKKRIKDLDPDYLKFLSQKELEDIIEKERSAKNHISEEQLADVYKALSGKRDLTVDTPVGLGLNSIRNPSGDQPVTAVKAPESDSSATPFTGAHGKAWKKDTNDKSSIAQELDGWATTVQDFTRTDKSNETYHTCVACSNQYKRDQLTTDHQVPFETLKERAFDLAHYASLSVQHETEVRKQFTNFDAYFVKNSQNHYFPTNAMVNDYSNDLKNSLRICSGCNGIVGGKGTVSPVEFFRSTPMFGETFLKFALNGATQPNEFFGNPDPNTGWGEKAREWIEKIIVKFTDIISKVSQMKDERVRDLTTLQSEVYEAANSNVPQIKSQMKKRKAKFNNRHLAAASGIGVEQSIAEREKFTDYEDGVSDEEDLVDELKGAVTRTLDEREKKKKRKTDKYTGKLEAQLKGTDDGKTTLSSSLARNDAIQRRQILENMARCEVLGLKYEGTALEGTTTVDAGITEEAKKTAIAELEQLQNEAYSLGVNNKSAPMVPIAWLFQASSFQKVFALIRDANQRGLDLAVQYEQNRTFE